MLMALTRFGATDPSLPPVLPSMTSALSRRRAIFGAVALGVAPAAAVPAIAAPSPDTELLDLIAQHPVVVDQWHDARRAADRLERLAVAARPARPAALEHRAGDLGGIGLGLAEVGEPIGDEGVPPRWYGNKAVAWLQVARPLRRWSDSAQAMVPNPVAETRRAEILKANDVWEAACDGSDHRIGLTAAEAAVEATFDALSDLEVRLNGLVPRTMAGLAAKAAWAAGSEDEGVMEMVLHQVAAFSLAA